MMHKLNSLKSLAVLSLLLFLGACASISKQEPCPPDTQDLPSCPPLGAVDDPFINELYEDRTWAPGNELDFDPIELGKKADIPIQPALTRLLGPTAHAAIDSLAAKIWMIENAAHTIDFTYYIFKPDLVGYSMLGAMCNAVQRGVDIRVMVDALGSFSAANAPLKSLETCADDAGFIRNSAGELTTKKARVQVVIFNALSKPSNPNRRSHDKLLVMDGSFPEKAVVITGGRNISEDYYGIRGDGSVDPDPFRDAEIILRSHPAEVDAAGELSVGKLSEAYTTVLFLIDKNKRIKPSRAEGDMPYYQKERRKSAEALARLKSYEYFKPHLEEMPEFMTSGFHDARVRLAHELGNITDTAVTREVERNLESNPNSIMSILAEISDARPDGKTARIVSPYLFLAEYRNKKGVIVKDEAEAMRQWLTDHPEATLEIISNSVLTSDNFPAQSVIDMETAPRLLFTQEQWDAWLAAAGRDEMNSEFVNSDEWAELVNHPRLKIYETGRLDSVLLGKGTENYGKLHAKFLLEEDFGFIGTSNFDYRSRLYNNEMGFFVVSAGLQADLNEAFDYLVDSSYRWGSPEWFQLRKEIMDKKGIKGRSTANQRRLYKTLKNTGVIWWL
jgi:putative cardiolipin synthase